MATRAAADASLDFDVAILGGGLAGNLLARQLRRTLPELRIGLFERSTSTSYKVGEATVEIAANYLDPPAGSLELSVRESAAEERPALLLRRRSAAVSRCTR